MKGIYKDGYYEGSIELRDVFNRRCVKCGRGDFAQGRAMRIRASVVFWNVVFSLMFTCPLLFSEPSLNTACALNRVFYTCTLQIIHAPPDQSL
uniref:Uncharacterized protein n=1 Tax=Neogobius melanostomus TaxID=47308 RepID=A0A8C6V159_9GOBI